MSSLPASHRVPADLSAPAEKLADGSKLTHLPDGSVSRRMNVAQLLAEEFASGGVTRVHEDGTQEQLPPNPDVVVGGVRGHDALRARQQFRVAGRLRARRATARPAVVRRTPAARPAARRPLRTSSSSRTSSADPGDDPDLPAPAPRRREPPPPPPSRRYRPRPIQPRRDWLDWPSERLGALRLAYAARRPALRRGPREELRRG